MKLQYFSDTDTLYINLSNAKPVNTDAITDNLIVDFDADEQVIGITIEQASRVTDLAAIVAIDLPKIVAPAS